MSVKSIKVKNLLSFDELIINDFYDINCIVGMNNVGKSNLLKVIKFFYSKLDDKRELPLRLNHNYSSYGLITITYTITPRMKKRLRELGKDFFSTSDDLYDRNDTIYDLTLKINSNDTISWSEKNKKILSIINNYYPFFDIESRHISLYNWNKLWNLISGLKSFNISKLEEIIFNNESLKNNSTYKEYKKYVDDIKNTIETTNYTYREKILSFIKVQLRGDGFLNENNTLESQSDGTNSHKFIETFLKLLILLTRRDYIVPVVYIDEPEIGLHPKKNEELISNLYEVYIKNSTKVPYPTLLFSTHSANIVKQIIKLFPSQQVLHFSKNKKEHTRISKLNSIFEEKFVNIFSDNEARLFFSKFILFVEGETELELFSNKSLTTIFPLLNEIDIYKSSSNVIGSNINPSNLNATIPFLFLFDSDKIYNLRTDNKCVTLNFVNKNEKLYLLPTKRNEDEYNKLILKYKKGYNKKYIIISRLLEKLKTFNNKKFKYNAVTLSVNNTNFLITNNLIKEYLKMKNVFYLKTTIEETLINRDSKELFFLWLKNDYNIDFSPLTFKIKQLTITRTFYKKRDGIGKIIKLNPRESMITKTIEFRRKRKYISNVILEYMRVHFFQGKFGNLEKTIIANNKKDIMAKRHYNTIIKSLKSSNSSLNITDKQKATIYKNLEITDVTKISEIRTNLFNKVKSFNINVNDKTNGWVTKFLNFSIYQIEKNTEKDEVKNQFFKNFRELYDIIESIEEKL